MHCKRKFYKEVRIRSAKTLKDKLELKFLDTKPKLIGMSLEKYPPLGLKNQRVGIDFFQLNMEPLWRARIF